MSDSKTADLQLDLARVIPAGPEEELARELQDLEKYAGLNNTKDL